MPPGPPGPRLPILERQEERERLVRLLARGRSVRLTGPAGSGRTALLNAVGDDCADLAPDGVVRLSGYKRTTTDLLYGLFEAVYRSPLHRPDREGLLALVHSIGAVVVLDDLELGGTALQELLDATPECAFLFGTTPDVAAPTADSNLEEVFLAGLGRSASIELLERVVERTLTDEEANWAGDLWFESEGLPLRFVHAGALLRQRDRLRTDPEAFDGYDDEAADAPFGRPEPVDVPLPSLGEGAAPAALLASRLSEAARDTLRFAVALGGELPHQAHLPALVGDTHADAALGELFLCGLLSPAGPRYRLAAGVLAQLEASGYGADADVRARTAAQHYAWWSGHPSVTPERAVAEADAVLASMAPLVPGDQTGQTSAAVLLARSAAPPSPRACSGEPGRRSSGSARRPPGSPVRWRKRPTSTTSWASSPCAREIWTGPGPSWRPPSACAARSPTRRGQSPAAGRSPSSRTAPANRRSSAVPRPATSRRRDVTRIRPCRPRVYPRPCRCSPGMPRSRPL